MEEELEAKRTEYCLRCGGACCTVHLPDEGAVRCPRQNEDGSCSVYRERYAEGMPDVVAIGYYRSRRYRELDGTPALRAFYCGRIEQIIAAGMLPKHIAEKCCYSNPRVLEENSP